jgi:hypothetical protein
MRDLTTTLRYYTHAQEHLRKAAADQFDAAVWTRPRQQMATVG